MNGRILFTSDNKISTYNKNEISNVYFQVPKK